MGVLLLSVVTAGLYLHQNDHERISELELQLSTLREQEKQSAVDRRVSKQMEEIAYGQQALSEERSKEAYRQYIIAGNEEAAMAAAQTAIDAAHGIVMHKDMPARAIVNIGGEYQIGPVTLGLNIHNLLGTHYYRSGMNTNVIPQQSRWFLASVGIRL